MSDELECPYCEGKGPPQHPFCDRCGGTGKLPVLDLDAICPPDANRICTPERDRQRIVEEVARRWPSLARSSHTRIDDLVNFVLDASEATQGRLEDAQQGEACAVEQHAQERELRLAAERERDEAVRSKRATHECSTALRTTAQQEVERLMVALRALVRDGGRTQPVGYESCKSRALAACEEKHDG